MSELADRLLRAAADTPGVAADETADAIADAALRQFEAAGISRSTMEQVARRAQVARITVYRHFPGRDALVQAVMLREVRRFLSDLDAALAPFSDPDERFVEGFLFVLEAIRGHRLLQRVLEREPEVLLPHLTVNGGPLIDAGRAYLAARLAEDREGGRSTEETTVIADVVMRLVLSFLLTPSAVVDLDDADQARAFAMRYLRPVLDASG